jgi:uncharacterized membrane protein YfcA
MAFLVASGSMTGAWIATRFAVKRGPGIVRIILLVTVFVSAIYYTGLFDLALKMLGV